MEDHVAIKHELMRVAKKNLAIIKNGYYQLGDQDFLLDRIARVDYWPAAETKRFSASFFEKFDASHHGQIDLMAETTADACARLANQNPVALNFASARRPGGSFLTGTMAQEEDLCRRTTLYARLESGLQETEFYNEGLADSYYSDAMLYSPEVLIIRDSNFKLQSPVKTSIITCAAPNNSSPHGKDPERLAKVLVERIRNVLGLALYTGHRTIILGAFGCGVFNNDPEMVAEIFYKYLVGRKFCRYFDRVVFAIPAGPNLDTFSNMFSQ